MGRLVVLPVLVAGLVVSGCGLFDGNRNRQMEQGNRLYAQGSYIQAYREYKPLADRGNAEAQFAIGYMYERGNLGGIFGMFGADPDYGEAGQWYRKAAERGYSKAQSNLGRMYARGLGVARNDAEAAKWYRLAAIQGLSEAQYNLAARYNRGSGVPRDSILSHAWASVAATNSTGTTRQSAERLRESEASKLTPKDLSTAQRLAKEWRPGAEMTPPRLPEASPSVAAPVRAASSIEGRLKELKRLRDLGLIDDDEYAEMRKNILRDL